MNKVGRSRVLDEAAWGILEKGKDMKVAFAGSSGLLCSRNFVIYREVLVGQRKSGKAPVGDEKKTAKDPGDDADDAWGGNGICSLCRLRVDDLGGLAS